MQNYIFLSLLLTLLTACPFLVAPAHAGPIPEYRPLRLPLHEWHLGICEQRPDLRRG